jgi:cell fate (sporulation/competence/biofilm development) regulator YlbF (YheA/YmcA/DUF963 family)
VKPLSIDEAKEFRAYLERVRDCARAGKEAPDATAAARRELWRIQASAMHLHEWVNDFLESENEG